MLKEPSQRLHTSDPILSQAQLYPYLLEDGEKFPCFLVLPGGGYEDVVHSEGPPIAAWFNSMGISAVVLEYTVSRGDRSKSIYPQPQQQALYAMRWLRKNAEFLNIDPRKIGVIGFSAGGHLAACVANGFDRESWLRDPDNALSGISSRPEACILSYAVLSTTGAYAHTGSMHNLMGDSCKTSPIIKELDWPSSVHPKAPDTFVWHTVEDATVPVENAYHMALALQQKKVPHELHIFPQGAHGLGICAIDHRRQSSVAQWKQLAHRWLAEIGF